MIVNGKNQYYVLTVQNTACYYLRGLDTNVFFINLKNTPHSNLDQLSFNQSENYSKNRSIMPLFSIFRFNISYFFFVYYIFINIKIK